MDKNLIIRRIFKGVIALILVGALAAVTYLRATEEPVRTRSIEDIEREEGKSVTTANPEKRDFSDYIRADATFRAPRRYVLRANVNEKVERVEVDVGDTVEAGELLVLFRKDDIHSEIDAAAARLEEAERNYERFSNLLERGVVSEDVVDARLTAVQDARAGMRRARSRLEFAEVRAPLRDELDYTEGSVQVSARSVDPGEFKAAGQPLLTLTDMSVLEVEAYVPESALKYLRRGSSIEYRLEHEDEWREARLQRVSPESDDPHRFFTVYAVTDNFMESGLWGLRPGMYARVRIPRIIRESSMAVPSRALRITEEGCCLVFVVDPHGGGRENGVSGVAREISLETGMRAGDWVEVLSPDMRGDELIILNPRLDMRDKDKVRVVQ